MHTIPIQRTITFQKKIQENKLDAVLLTDPDSIYYLSGFSGYLGMDFGRPTMMWVPAYGDCTIITPLMESEMCRHITWVQDIYTWSDGVDSEWKSAIRQLIKSDKTRLGIEEYRIPLIVLQYVNKEFPETIITDASQLLAGMRVIKDPEEIDILRKAGKVAVSMVKAAKQVIREGISEYEVALACIDAGTREGAGLLEGTPLQNFFSPTIYNLQILQSGHDTSMVHRRSSIKKIQHGDPVYLCFCGLANFKHYKLGFDREFFVGSVTDEAARMYEIALKAQIAALDAIGPGAVAEEVHSAANAVYQDAGFSPGYRTGRSVGCSFCETPELKKGDKTVLQPGMTFAVDGGITVPNQYGARVGDSVLVTEEGFEYLTPYPKKLCVL
ncbi:MAG: aminopeptidase P family protein [Candidatus Electrothrix sp. AR4]|nr:aminopeptidase P family protein [Candidatus Electrothrix sp. AR4]